MKVNRIFLRAGLALVLLLAVTSCRTIQYREIQSDFQRAVEAETARAESPFVDWYGGVADTLTDDFISKLDEKLQPNAWMLRGLSEWRSGSYSDASLSATKGLAEVERQKPAAPNLGSSRDGIVLKMLPGLVQDSKLRDRVQALGAAKLTEQDYRANFHQQFPAALTTFHEAKQSFAAPTPAAVKHYWNFQVWRVLQNWRITLGKLPVGEDATKQDYAEANTKCASLFSDVTGVTDLASAIKAAKEAIPADHPYRRLIDFEEK